MNRPVLTGDCEAVLSGHSARENCQATNRPLLSILVPVYNAQGFLRQTVASIMSGMLDRVEVIFLDDCSMDGSWDLLQQLDQVHDHEMQLLRHEKNQGVSVARNTLLEAATGAYLWFLDADDLLMPGAVHSVLSALEQNQPDLLMFDFRVLRNKPRFKHRLRGEMHRRTFHGRSNALIQDRSRILQGLFLAGQFHPWSKVVRRSCWGDDEQKLRFPQGHVFAEDMATFSRLALRIDSAFYLPEPLVLYRQHSGNVMASMDLQKIRGLSSALRHFRQNLDALHRRDQWQADKEAEFAISHLALRNFLGAMRFLQRHPELDQVAVAKEFRLDYLASTFMSSRALLNAYLRRGWWLRYLRARKVLRGM